MTLYDLPAPAKLNLFLHVVGRRSDGYHLLQSVFRLVSLSDSLSIDLRRDGQVSCQTDRGAQAQEPPDIVLQAANLLQQVTGCPLGAHIDLRKRIPVGGGLGGGSSDAATVLMALNRLWRTGLNRQQLMEVGLRLGADVPFFIHGRSAFVQGIGEKMDSVDLPDLSYLIIQPAVAISTAGIFGSPDLTRDSEPVKISDFSGLSHFVMPAKASSGVTQARSGFGRNDLQRHVEVAYPTVEAAINWARGNGLAVRLSGSGACFFAEFDEPQQAELARSVLAAKMESFNDHSESRVVEQILACDGLCEHPLRQWVKN